MCVRPLFEMGREHVSLIQLRGSRLMHTIDQSKGQHEHIEGAHQSDRSDSPLSTSLLLGWQRLHFLPSPSALELTWDGIQQLSFIRQLLQLTIRNNSTIRFNKYKYMLQPPFVRI